MCLWPSFMWFEDLFFLQFSHLSTRCQCFTSKLLSNSFCIGLEVDSRLELREDFALHKWNSFWNIQYIIWHTAPVNKSDLISLLLYASYFLGIKIMTWSVVCDERNQSTNPVCGPYNSCYLYCSFIEAPQKLWTWFPSRF